MERNGSRVFWGVSATDGVFTTMHCYLRKGETFSKVDLTGCITFDDLTERVRRGIDWGERPLGKDKS